MITRIAAMVCLVCLWLGQAGISHAENWQWVHSSEALRAEIDTDSVQKIGKEEYRVWTRILNAKGEVIGKDMIEYQVKKDKYLMYYGMERTIAYMEDGEVKKWTKPKYKPIYPIGMDGYFLAYLNDRFGDKSVKAPDWQWFYSTDTTTYTIEVGTVSCVDGVYSAWIRGYTPHLAKYSEPYSHMRIEFKQDRFGTLLLREVYSVSNAGPHPDASAWRLVEGDVTAEKAYKAILYHLGEK